ncbi:hypothetical protein L3Q82_002667 [Scortum barcoo]|uniref:Uncharacterized protein n=1 Tax=Scortum barcoo TaxID=214431 RepID=A0ACB8VX73_9TELE|nr:hypothetical protein L3Q82_002667 [Scortum barcoo]
MYSVKPHGEDIDNMTDCITEYIRFCEDTTVPARTVHCFSNNKPWITRDLKALLNKKKRAFRAGDREEQRRVQHKLRDMLRTCKDNYRRKLEAKLQQNNLNPCQPPYDTSGPPHTHIVPNGSTHPQQSPVQHLSICPPPSPPPPPPPPTSASNPCPTVTTGQVKRQLERLHQRKAAGPDGITPRILKTCASQLSPVLGHLYNLSLSQEKVPMLWKTSCLVPVPKEVEAIRPGRLQTSCPHISCDEGPGETGLSPAEATGVDDAVIIYLLQRAHMHLDGGGGTVRITFFDFSSAFNTIQPLLLGEKLQVMGVDDTMISWITDYLTGRPQFVRLGSVLSDVVNHLRLNVNKTREMVIEGEVEDYKYLGVVIDNRLDWKS